MLHLENFFEKSFALLLTTPSIGWLIFYTLQFPHLYVTMASHEKNTGE